MKRENLYALIIACILVLMVCVALNSCAADSKGEVVGKGRAGSDLYLMVLCDGCKESTAVQVTQKEWESYNTGDAYGEK